MWSFVLSDATLSADVDTLSAHHVPYIPMHSETDPAQLIAECAAAVDFEELVVIAIREAKSSTKVATLFAAPSQQADAEASRKTSLCSQEQSGHSAWCRIPCSTKPPMKRKSPSFAKRGLQKIQRRETACTTKTFSLVSIFHCSNQVPSCAPGLFPIGRLRTAHVGNANSLIL